MIEQLFGSKTRVKLLRLFYSNPNRSFYVREITRKIDEQINSVRRELANLLNIGIISSDTTDNKLFYEVNQKFEFYQPLAEIFGGGGAVKTVKTVAPVAGDGQEFDLKVLGNVQLIVFTGQFTRDERSGTDVLIVGDINQTQLGNFIEDLEQKEGKELRYTVMTHGDYLYRQEIKDRFLSNVLASKKQVVFDDLPGKTKEEK